MELRQLCTQNERQIFAECLAQARATRGLAAREVARSRLGDAHLSFGNVYAIFDKPDDPTEAMLGGFIIHDLATLPQSFPRPDLSHLPARYVLEGSELWSLSTGVGRAAAAAAAAVTGLLQAKAVLVYPVVRPLDLTPRYSKFHFVNAGEPIVNPYGEATDGGEIWVQPMLLTGAPLEAYVKFGLDAMFFGGSDPVLRRLNISGFDRLDRAAPGSGRVPEAGPTSTSDQSHNGHNGSAAS